MRRDRAADLLFTVQLRGRELLLYVVIEHKSGSDRMTALQVLHYVLRLWDELLERRRRAGRPAPRYLPPVLPILFHHGVRPFAAPLSIRPLVDVRGLPPRLARALLRHQPELRLLLDDVTAQSDAAIAARQLSLMAHVSMLFLKHLGCAAPRDLERFLQRVQTLLQQLLEDRRSASLLAWFCFYAVATSQQPDAAEAVLRQTLEPRIAGAMMNGLQKLLKQASEAGKLEGKREGEADGRAAVLLRQLDRRFGPLSAAVVRRVRAAPIRELDRFALRLLDAPTLQAVFAAD